jgi:hypothetical protein
MQDVSLKNASHVRHTVDDEWLQLATGHRKIDRDVNVTARVDC